MEHKQATSPSSKITLAIITYNRLPYLKEAIKSLEEEEKNLHEIIVVNDGSNDDTYGYLRSSPLTKLNVINHSQNMGRPAARNTAIKNLNSEYILWLDDDDLLVSGSTAKLNQIIAQHPDEMILYGNLIKCDEELNEIGLFHYKAVPHSELLAHLAKGNPFPNVGTLIKKDLFEAIGCYDQSFERAQDYHFWLKAALSGYRFFFYGFEAVKYRTGKKLNPIPPDRPAPLRSKDYAAKVILELFHQKDLQEVFPLYNWDTDFENSYHTAIGQFTDALYRLGALDEALDLVQTALLQSKHKDTLYRRAFIQKEMCNFGKAAFDFSDLALMEHRNLSAYKKKDQIPSTNSLSNLKRKNASAHQKENRISSQLNEKFDNTINKLITHPDKQATKFIDLTRITLQPVIANPRDYYQFSAAKNSTTAMIISLYRRNHTTPYCYWGYVKYTLLQLIAHLEKPFKYKIIIVFDDKNLLEMNQTTNSAKSEREAIELHEMQNCGHLLKFLRDEHNIEFFFHPQASLLSRMPSVVFSSRQFERIDCFFRIDADSLSRFDKPFEFNAKFGYSHFKAVSVKQMLEEHLNIPSCLDNNWPDKKSYLESFYKIAPADSQWRWWLPIILQPSVLARMQRDIK